MWNSSLTQKNIEDLERIQKTAFKVILQNKYKNYRIEITPVGGIVEFHQYSDNERHSKKPL